MSPFQVENIIFDSDGGIGFQKFRCENIHLMKYQKKDTKFILHSLFKTYVNYDVLKVSTDIPNDKSY